MHTQIYRPIKGTQNGAQPKSYAPPNSNLRVFHLMQTFHVVTFLPLTLGDQMVYQPIYILNQHILIVSITYIDIEGNR